MCVLDLFIHIFGLRNFNLCLFVAQLKIHRDRDIYIYIYREIARGIFVVALFLFVLCYCCCHVMLCCFV